MKVTPAVLMSLLAVEDVLFDIGACLICRSLRAYACGVRNFWSITVRKIDPSKTLSAPLLPLELAQSCCYRTQSMPFCSKTNRTYIGARARFCLCYTHAVYAICTEEAALFWRPL